MKKGELSAFVGEAVPAEVLRRSALDLQARDPGLSDADAAELAGDLAAIELSMGDARAGRGQPMKQAVREIAEGLGLHLHTL